MTIIEINAMRAKHRKLFNDKYNSHQEFKEAHERIIVDLDRQEQLVHDELVKRIRKHFKGLIPDIKVSQTQLKITFEDIFIFAYLYNDWACVHISKKLAKIITKEYEEVYGEPKVTMYIPSVLKTLDDRIDTINYAMMGNDIFRKIRADEKVVNGIIIKK